MRCGLIHSGGQLVGGKITTTRENCELAIEQYRAQLTDTGRTVDHLFIATATRVNNSDLATLMFHQPVDASVAERDVTVIPTALNRAEALAKCKEWAGYLTEEVTIIEIG